MPTHPNSRPVYSCASGRLCPDCGNALSRCNCPSEEKPPAGQQKIIIGRSTKGRKGSEVTTISGLRLSPAELKVLTAELKKRCGTGGTLKNGVIEIQGEHRDRLLAILLEKGWQGKKAGG